jgi:hypothetical protein
MNFRRALVCALVALTVGGTSLLTPWHGTAAPASPDTKGAAAVLAPMAGASGQDGGRNEALEIALGVAGVLGTLAGSAIGYRGGKSVERSEAIRERSSAERRDVDEFVKACGAVSDLLQRFVSPNPSLRDLRTLKESLQHLTAKSYLIRDKGIRECGDRLFDRALDVLAQAADSEPSQFATEGIKAYDELRKEAEEFLQELDRPKPGIVKRLRGDTHAPRPRLGDLSS